MTTPTYTLKTGRSDTRPASRPTTAMPVRREHRERDFGVGYGRSSGYASERRYASDWTGAARFRCG